MAGDASAELLRPPLPRGGRPGPGPGVLGALGAGRTSPRSTGTWARSASSPGFQGRGIGGALMRAVCAWLDEGGRLAWLETDKERNVRFYAALGFEVVGTDTVLDVETWYMRRDPRRVRARVRGPSRGRDLRVVPPLLRRPAPGELRRRRGRCGAGRGAVGALDARRLAPPTSASPPTMSSSRSATTCGPGYKTGEGVDPSCSRPSSLSSRPRSWRWAWWSGPWWSSRPTTRSASAAAVASDDEAVAQVLVCTPDKDLAQCVRGQRVSCSSTGART